MKVTGENRSTRRKTRPSATLSTTNPTHTAPGSNPGLRDERPAANRLSHGTAFGGGKTAVHAIKSYEGMEVWLHCFLMSALGGNQRPSSRPGGFTPGEKSASDSHRAALGTLGKKKIVAHAGNWTARSQTYGVHLSRCRDFAAPALKFWLPENILVTRWKTGLKFSGALLLWLSPRSGVLEWFVLVAILPCLHTGQV
jgi:hypothetical protein